MKILLINREYDSFANWFPTNLAYIAASLRKQGHEVEVYDNALYHWSYDRLTNYLDNTTFDIVGFGVCGGYFEYKQAKLLTAAISRSVRRPRFRVVVGGHLFSPDPDYFLDKWDIDYVVKGEGEELGGMLAEIGTFPIKEKTWMQFPLIQDLDTIPFPAYDLFDLNHYVLHRFHAHMKRSDRALPMISSRGCKFNCNFCYRMDKGQRLRSPLNVVEEIRYLQKTYDINYISFADELFMASTERSMMMADALGPLNIRWDCMGRLNYAKPGVLKAMKRAGCTFINYGIEQFDNQALKAMNKALTEEMIVKGVENTLATGISPGLNVIWGNVGDTYESLWKSVDFLLAYDDQVQLRTIRPVTPYPGSPLYDLAVKEGLIKDIEDFYENKHTNSDLRTCDFMGLTDEEFYKALKAANIQLASNYYEQLKKRTIKQIHNLYDNRDATFRGFRAV